MKKSRISRTVRWASLGLLLAAVTATGSARQPGQDEREIPPTAGVTPIDTPAIARTSVTPVRRSTPATTRTPRPAVAGLSAARGGPRAAHSKSKSTDTRVVETWALLSVLVVALGWATIRMRRHRLDPESMPEPVDLNVPPSSNPYPYTYP